MQDPVHREELRGYTIEIHQDTDARNPRKEFDHAFTMVCCHREYNLGDEQVTDPEAAIRDVYHEHGPKLEDDPEQWTLNHLDECRVIWLPLYLYDHSGITMNTTGFSCQWDSGIVGFIYISRDDAHKEWTTASERMSEEEFSHLIKMYMKAEVAEYDDYLTGDVYGYVITKTDTEEEISSCWGFYGAYDADDGVLQAARQDVPDEPAKPDNTIIMVFHDNGTVEFTRNPKLYPFFEGRGEMERISEIRKDLKLNKFWIEWLRGPNKGPHDYGTLWQYRPHMLPLNSGLRSGASMAEDVVVFDTYEQAVEHEVMVLNAMRLAGESFVENPLETLENTD